MNYVKTKLLIQTVDQLQTDDDPDASTLTLCELMETLDSILRKSQMVQVTSGLRSIHPRLAFQKPQSDKCIASFLPDIIPDSSSITILKHVEPVNFEPCINIPNIITI